MRFGRYVTVQSGGVDTDQGAGVRIVDGGSRGLRQQRLWVCVRCAVFVTCQAASRLRVTGIVHQKALLQSL
jgi:hypothetical protein